MSNITLNTIRIGNFSSSEIIALLSMGSREMTDDEKAEHKRLNPKSLKKNIECWPGKAALTYILEKNMERRLGISLDNDTEARQLSWGTLLERLVAMMLDEYYDFTPSTTHVHPYIPTWVGSRDGLSKDTETVVDIKCPYTRKSFCGLVQPIYDELEGMDAMNALRNGYTDKNGIAYPPHCDAEKYYTQIVSNACISGSKYGELIVYMPYQSEIKAIQHAAEKAITEGEGQFYFIASSRPDQLPYIKDGGYYSNLNIIRFLIPEEDKILLENTVKKASELLIKIP